MSRSATLISRVIRARVEHRCASCRKIIERHEKYYHNRSVDDGSVFTTKLCLGCYAELTASELWSQSDGWDPEDVIPDHPDDARTEHGRMVSSRRRMQEDQHAWIMRRYLGVGEPPPYVRKQLPKVRQERSG